MGQVGVQTSQYDLQLGINSQRMGSQTIPLANLLGQMCDDEYLFRNSMMPCCAVRQLDRRQPRGAPAVMTYVRSRSGNRMMELNSICSPAQRPHLFAVGGGDPYLRLYDRRATSARGHARV